MRTALLLAAMIGVTGLTGCANTSTASDVANAQEVRVDGQGYRLTPLTAATWTVNPSGLGASRAVPVSHQPALLKAIEKASGCRVTDSDYSRGGLQLDAQVDCGSTLKN